MNNNHLIDLLQTDLRNERKHLGFYLQASVMVQGLHREELREFFMEQAKDELQHVAEFSELIVHLGGVPEMGVSNFPSDGTDPVELLRYAAEMEQQVANTYASRLVMTHEMENAATAYAHVFYEEQIKDSQHTAWEINQMVKTPWLGLKLGVEK